MNPKQIKRIDMDSTNTTIQDPNTRYVLTNSKSKVKFVTIRWIIK